MKSIFLLIATFITFTASAEVKPDGALVPFMCGANTLESLAAAEFASEVCLYDVQGQYDLLVVGFTNAQGTSYYVVTGKNRGTTSDTLLLSKAVTKESGNYTHLNGWEKTVALEVLFSGTASSGVSISGANFSAQLETVYVTQSL